MTTGVAFFKWTDKGVHGYRETVDRLGENMKLAEKFGVEIKDVYWTAPEEMREVIAVGG
jgi:uncharacterized protein with GYD domain